MSKLSRILALSALLAAAAGANVSTAQEKTKTPKAAKKAGTVKIKQSDKNDRFYFSIYDSDDKYIAGGPAKGFDTKKDAADAVEALKTALDGAKLDYVKGDHKDDDKDEKKDTKKEPKKEKKGG